MCHKGYTVLFKNDTPATRVYDLYIKYKIQNNIVLIYISNDGEFHIMGYDMKSYNIEDVQSIRDHNYKVLLETGSFDSLDYGSPIVIDSNINIYLSVIGIYGPKFKYSKHINTLAYEYTKTIGLHKVPRIITHMDIRELKSNMLKLPINIKFRKDNDMYSTILPFVALKSNETNDIIFDTYVYGPIYISSYKKDLRDIMILLFSQKHPMININTNYPRDITFIIKK